MIKQHNKPLLMCFKNSNIASSLTNMRLRMNTLIIAQCYLDKAKSSKKEFKMSFSNFANLKQQTHCAYSGIKFQLKGDFSFSFERLDNSKGYEDGNVIPVCRTLNSCRSNIETSDGVENEIKQFQQKIDSRLVALESVLKEMESLENKPLTDKKPIIKGKHLRQFAYQYDIWLLKNVLISKKEAEIKISKNILKNNAKKAKTIASHNKIIAELSIIKEKHINDRDNARKVIENLFLGRESNILFPGLFSGEKQNVRYAELEKMEKGLNENIKSYKKVVDNLKIVKKGLQKFENLSYIDVLCLKIGYPLGTPRSKVIKQAMSMKLSNEVW